MMMFADFEHHDTVYSALCEKIELLETRLKMYQDILDDKDREIVQLKAEGAEIDG